MGGFLLNYAVPYAQSSCLPCARGGGPLAAVGLSPLLNMIYHTLIVNSQLSTALAQAMLAHTQSLP